MLDKALGNDLGQYLSRLRPCQLPAVRKAERDRRGEVARIPLAHTGCTASRDWLIARSINPPVGKARVARAMGAAAGAPASLGIGGMTTSADSVVTAGI